MVVDIHEQEMIEKYVTNKNDDGSHKMSQKEIDELFESIDISKYNDAE